MVYFPIMTHQEMSKYIAEQVQAKRLSFNFSQQSLSERSGVSLGVLKKFEQSGKISLESLLKVAFALDNLEEFKELFKQNDLENLTSLDELLKHKKRKRGRQ